jgi:hypothetical protein
MSRAFDTIDRAKLMLILSDEVQLDEDELRMCQSLLAETNLQVKLGKVLSDPFATTIGTPQGDGLSPILFAVYLESALRQVRQEAGLRPISDEGLPPEAIYADDTDFISTVLSFLKQMEIVIPPTIGRYSLIANPTKWERTVLELASALWRKTKKLGSLLGDAEDIERRMSLATASFKSLRLLWERRKVTSVSTRMHAYKALVLPVLLYNCGTWGVTEATMHKLEVFHRRQLREVLGVRTRGVHNKDLYKRCNTCPLRGQITRARWSLFGHVLRLTMDTPAQMAMDYYCQLHEDDINPRGTPKMTLPVRLFREYRAYKIEYQLRGRSIRNMGRLLAELRVIAADRQKWRELVDSICGMNIWLD